MPTTVPRSKAISSARPAPRNNAVTSPKPRTPPAKPPAVKEQGWLAKASQGTVATVKGWVNDVKTQVVAAPVRSNTGDEPHDGKLVGAGGVTFSVKTALKDIKPYLPEGGRKPDGLIVHVNGISTTLKEQGTALQALANTSGAAVVGIHNATQGAGKDVLQAGRDKLNRGHNPASTALLKVINSALVDRKPVHLVGHSQGALIISRSLERAVNVMKEKGLSDQQIEDRLSVVSVETFGGASHTFPNGPKYVHYVNIVDPVPMTTGLGSIRPTDPGKNAKVVKFTDWNGGLAGNHSFADTYLLHRKPFAETYTGKNPK